MGSACDSLVCPPLCRKPEVKLRQGPEPRLAMCMVTGQWESLPPLLQAGTAYELVQVIMNN